MGSQMDREIVREREGREGKTECKKGKKNKGGKNLREAMGNLGSRERIYHRESYRESDDQRKKLMED